MAHLIRYVSIAMLFLMCGPASARIASIPGWSYSQSEKGIVMSTPCGGGTDIVAYGIYPAYPTNADSKSVWFAGQVNTLIEGWTGYRRANAQLAAVAAEGPVMFQTIEFESEPGKRWSAVVLGTFVGRVGQLYAVVTATSTDESDPRLQAAVGHAMASIRGNFTLSPQSLRQVPQGIPQPSGFSGSPLGTLITSQLRSFPSHRLDPETRQLVVTSSGRFFEARVSDYVAQGKLVKNDALGAYEVTYGDGSFDVIPMACAAFQGSANPSAPPPSVSQATTAQPPTATGRNCRKATKEVFGQRQATTCDFRGVCTFGSVFDTQIVETGEIICD